MLEAGDLGKREGPRSRDSTPTARPVWRWITMLLFWWMKHTTWRSISGAICWIQTNVNRAQGCAKAHRPWGTYCTAESLCTQKPVWLSERRSGVRILTEITWCSDWISSKQTQPKPGVGLTDSVTGEIILASNALRAEKNQIHSSRPGYYYNYTTPNGCRFKNKTKSFLRGVNKLRPLPYYRCHDYLGRDWITVLVWFARA